MMDWTRDRLDLGWNELVMDWTKTDWNKTDWNKTDWNKTDWTGDGMNKTPNIWLTYTLALVLTASPIFAGSLDEPAPFNTRRLWIPFDHGKPEEGSFLLQYEFGSLFNPEIPTVFVITDGLQNPSSLPSPASLQKDVFGTGMNVVRVSPRGASLELQGQYQPPEGDTDWVKAFRYLNAEQWIEDIEAVRQEILPSHQVLLFGQGSGGFLAHQYLARYGEHVERFFSQETLPPHLDADMEPPKLDFSSPQDGRQEHGQTAAAWVRMFELEQSVIKLGADGDTMIADPQEPLSKHNPLFELHAQGVIPTPMADFTPPEDFATEVLVLSAHKNHRIDQRSQVSLAARYPRGHFLLVEDDHAFRALKSSGHHGPLVQKFLLQGYRSKAFQKILTELATLERKK